MQQWEYREITIPLSLRLESSGVPNPSDLASFEGEQGILSQHLRLAAQEGWAAAEPMDWDSLHAAGRFATEVECSAEEPERYQTLYRSVTIRLKRPAAAR